MVAPAAGILGAPPPSTSGPGRHPFKVVARVRIPLGAWSIDAHDCWRLDVSPLTRGTVACPASALNRLVVVAEQLCQLLRDPARRRIRRGHHPRPRDVRDERLCHAALQPRLLRGTVRPHRRRDRSPSDRHRAAPEPPPYREGGHRSRPAPRRTGLSRTRRLAGDPTRPPSRRVCARRARLPHNHPLAVVITMGPGRAAQRVAPSSTGRR